MCAKGFEFCIQLPIPNVIKSTSCACNVRCFGVLFVKVRFEFECEIGVYSV